jgi:hypothetical protein
MTTVLYLNGLVESEGIMILCIYKDAMFLSNLVLSNTRGFLSVFPLREKSRHWTRVPLFIPMKLTEQYGIRVT